MRATKLLQRKGKLFKYELNYCSSLERIRWSGWMARLERRRRGVGEDESGLYLDFISMGDFSSRYPSLV